MILCKFAARRALLSTNHNMLLLLCLYAASATDLEATVAALQAQVAALTAQVAALSRAGAPRHDGRRLDAVPPPNDSEERAQLMFDGVASVFAQGKALHVAVGDNYALSASNASLAVHQAMSVGGPVSIQPAPGTVTGGHTCEGALDSGQLCPSLSVAGTARVHDDAGHGVELGYSGERSWIQSYDRQNYVYEPLHLRASKVEMHASATTKAFAATTDGVFTKNAGAGFVYSFAAVTNGAKVSPTEGDPLILGAGAPGLSWRIPTAHLPNSAAVFEGAALRVRLVCMAGMDRTADGDDTSTTIRFEAMAPGGHNPAVDFEWRTGWYHSYWDARYLLRTPWIDVPVANVQQSPRDSSGAFAPYVALSVTPDSGEGLRLYQCEMVFADAAM